MIKSETINLAGMDYIYTYSDSKKFIRRDDGTLFASAYDPIGSGRTYEETNISLPKPPTKATVKE